MDTPQDFEMRLLEANDASIVSAAFVRMGWNKPETLYQRYVSEQLVGTRTCFVAFVHGQFAGYVTVNWRPSYPGFDQKIPEIQDLNVVEKFRRQGVATRLLDRAEAEVSQHFRVVGISVGLHPGYNAAQRMYVSRGYVPDGRGITYKDCYLEEGAQVVLDDDLVLHLTKQLARV